MDTVVVLSGGIDSATVAAEAVLMHGAGAVAAVTFAYGRKGEKQELAAAQNVAAHYSIRQEVIRLPFIGKLFRSSLLEDGGPLPTGEYSEASQRSTVVPFRNGIFLSIGVGFAESIGAREVLIGSHADDHATYPDCRPVFDAAMNAATVAGTHSEIEVRAPFARLQKWQIIERGNAAGVPWGITWSCYASGKEPCGVCNACWSRQQAFLVVEQRSFRVPGVRLLQIEAKE